MEYVRKNAKISAYLSVLTRKFAKWLANRRERRQFRKAAIDLRYCSEHMKKDIGWIDR